MKANTIAETPTGSIQRGNDNNTLMLQEEEQEHHHMNEFMVERKRIIKSINEIGQIVEDKSNHVRSQEEQLKCVDDNVMQSDKWSKKALGELSDMRYVVKSIKKRSQNFS